MATWRACLSVELRSDTPAFVDKTSPLHWRQDREMSGYNVLNMGIWYEPSCAGSVRPLSHGP